VPPCVQILKEKETPEQGNRFSKETPEQGNPILPVPQIPSDTVPFNEAPAMKAREICEAGKEALRSGKFDQVRINFAK
jgi:hypothetical protein